MNSYINTTPAIVWLKVTDYMCAWCQFELGGRVTARGKKVICLQHLPGARDILRMDSVPDIPVNAPVGNTMSYNRRTIIERGLKMDGDAVSSAFGITQEQLSLFLPIECPKMRMTTSGVLRPWTADICFGGKQAKAVQNLLREAFWNAVRNFDKNYSERMGGKAYRAIDMVLEFCAETGTSTEYADLIRREWSRQSKSRDKQEQ